jgi:hypothetical protein
MVHQSAGPEYGLLFFGVTFLALAVGGSLTGETLARFRGVIYRADNPKQFRWVVVAYYVGALYFIGLFFLDL